jgi:CHAT domain-containing protein/tetratricopeptide (TPR) repeat protein
MRVMKLIIIFLFLLPVTALLDDVSPLKEYEQLLLTADSLAEAAAYDSAAVIAAGAAEMAEEMYGREDSIVARVNSMLGLFYCRISDFSKAEVCIRKGLTIREHLFGPESIEAAASVFDLGRLYNFIGTHALGEELQRKALAMRERHLGPNHPDIATSYYYLAQVCRNQNKLDEAQRYYEKALQIREKLPDRKNRDMANSLLELASVYDRQGRYEKCREFYQRGLDIFRSICGPSHLSVAKTLNNIGGVCYAQGQLASAEQYYLESLTIKERILRPDHPDLGTTLGNLGDLYCNLGRFGEAEALFKRVLCIYEHEFGSDHPNVTHPLEYLGKMYYNRGDLIKAEEAFTKTLELRERKFGVNHPDVIAPLTYLAAIHVDLGEYDQAEILLQRALTISRRVFQPGHFLIADILHRLARLKMKQGQYAEAGRFLDSALVMRRAIYGNEHAAVAEALESKCELQCREKRAEAGLTLAAKACRIRMSHLETNASVMSEADALGLSKSIKGSIDMLLSSYYALPNPDSSACRVVADFILGSKGQVSDYIFDRRRRIVSENDSAVQMLAESLRSAKYRLSRLYVEGPGEDIVSYRTRLDSLGREANRLEAKLSSRSASFRRERENQKVSAEKLASSLPEGSILIEYFRYNCRDFILNKAEPHYLATIISRDEIPAIVELGQADEIEPLIEDYRRHMFRAANLGTIPDPVYKEENRMINQELFSRIWLPLEKYIAGHNLVFIAPDGELNTVSFAGLMDQDGHFLIEEFALQYLSSGRDIFRYRDGEKHNTGLFAIGDPDYDAPGYARAGNISIDGYIMADRKYSVPRNIRSGCGRLNEIFLGPLPGTRDEVKAVSSAWEESFREPINAFFGPDASEENFKRKAPGCRAIHLATHGYFLDGSCRIDMPQEAYAQEGGWVGENPLLRSGLFLAGSNLHGAGCDSIGVEDGILTAYEVSAMNLEGTDLVVLSACETGLGDIQVGEGVYGLRRAFQMAGAHTVISALWPLSDQYVSELLSDLYRRKDISLAEGMRRMQMARIAELRQNGQSDHPVSWAAFIAVGDWR